MVEQELPRPGYEYYRPAGQVGELYPCWRHIAVGETAFLHGSALLCDRCHQYLSTEDWKALVLDHGAICGGGHAED